MALIKRQKKEEGVPAWMVTFGDMNCLLLTFFVLLFSMMSLEKANYKGLSDKMQKMSGSGKVKTDTKPKNQESFFLENPEGEHKGKSLKSVPFPKLIRGVETTVQYLEKGVVVTLGGKSGFAPGEYALSDDQKKVLMEIQQSVIGKINVVEVRGFTSILPEDSLFLENGNPRKFHEGDPTEKADHWHLSFLRAKAAAEFLTDGGDPDPAKRIDKMQIKILALAYTEQMMREQHSKDEERARHNRRVEIKITPETAK